MSMKGVNIMSYDTSMGLEDLRDFVDDCERALDRIAAPKENDGIPGEVSTWRRIELLGELLHRYRIQLEQRSTPKHSERGA